MAELRYSVTADNSDFVRKMNETRDAVRRITRDAEANGQTLDGIFGTLESGLRKIALASAGAFSIAKAVDFAKQCIKVRGQIQSLETSFSTLLGNEEKAMEMVGQIKQFAATTPMDMTDLAQGAQTMLGFNIAAEKVMPMLKAIGDISMGDAQKFSSLSLAFSQMSATGKLMGQDLLQMINAGFNPLAEISAKTGKSIGDLKEEMEKGKITVEMVTEAFMSATAEGGKFHGMLENQAKGIIGAQAYLRGAIADMQNEIGESMQGMAVEGINMAATLVKNYKEVAETIAVLVAMYGAYRAAVVVTSAMEMSHIARLRQLVIAKNAVAAATTRLTAALMTNPYGIALAAVVALTYGIYKLATAQTEAEKISKKAREASANLSTSLEKETGKLDSLRKSLESAKRGSEEWKSAKDSIVAQYGQYNSRLDEEIEKTGTLASTYDSLTESIRKTMLARAMNKFDEENDVDFSDVQSKVSKGLEGNFSKWVDTGRKDEWMRHILEKKTVVLTEESKRSMKEAISKYMAGADIELTKEARDYLRQIDETWGGGNALKDIEAKRRASLAKQQGGRQLALDFGYTEKEADQLWNTRGTSSVVSTDTGKPADRNGSKIDKEIQKKKEELEKVKVGTEEWKKLDAEITALVKERKQYGDYDRDHKKKSGSTSAQLASKTAAEEQQLTGLLKRQAEERLKQQQSCEYELWQNRIDLMEDGEAKVLAQMQLDQAKEKAALRERQRQEVAEEIARQKAVFDAREDVKASKDKKYAREVFSTGDVDITEAAASLRELDKRIGETKGRLASLPDTNVSVTAEADMSLINEAREILASLKDVDLSVNAEAYTVEIERAIGLLSSLKDVDLSVYADVDADKIEETQKLLSSLKDVAVSVDATSTGTDISVDVEADTSAIERARELLDSISGKEITVTADADTESVESLKGELDALTAQRRQIELSVGDVDLSPLTEILERGEALEKDLAAKQAKAEQDRLDAARESMNAYLREFGSYQQKRLAIQEEYETKISEAQNEGQRMTLYAQRDKALADLDYSEWVDSGDIALAFGDIAKLSDSTIERLISDMERYREKVVATFDPEKIREYEEALTKLRDAQSEISFGAFASVIPDYFKQRQSAASQKDSAAENINAIYEERAAIYNRIFAIQERIKEAESSGEDTTELNNDLKEQEVALKGTDAAAKKARNAFQQLQEQWDRLNTPEAKFYGVCEAVAQTADMIGGLTDSLGSMLDAMGAGGLASAVGTLGEAMGSVQNVASGFAKGGLVGGIAAAAGEVMNWAGKLFAAGDRKHQKNIERLQEQIDTLQKSYEKLGRSADEAFSTDASELIDQQNTLLQQQKVLIERQIAEEEAKKKTDKEKVKQWREQLEEIDDTLEDNRKNAKEAIIGEDIKSAISEFAEAYASAWENGEDAASKSMSAVKNILTSALNELLKKNLQPKVQEFYDLLSQYAEGGFTDYELRALDIIKGQIDAASASMEEQYRTILDRYKDLDELKEELTDVSFDTVRDDFKSQLLDMEADASDFTESFTDMLRNALVEGLMDNKYDAMLKEWYDEFAEAMSDQTLTDGERDKLRQQYQSIIDQGIADRNAINEVIGGVAYSQSASAGGWESMGQDTADELNGRFTALTELNAIGNDLQQRQNALTAQILATLQGMGALSGGDGGTDPTLLAIKDMMFLSTGYLEDIRKYTKTLNSVDERLATLNTTIERRL